MSQKYFKHEFFSDGIPNEYLLQVKGSSHLNCKAIQETLSASSLNTNDCFVLVSGGMSYVWFGKVYKFLCKTQENILY